MNKMMTIEQDIYEVLEKAGYGKSLDNVCFKTAENTHNPQHLHTLEPDQESILYSTCDWLKKYAATVTDKADMVFNCKTEDIICSLYGHGSKGLIWIEKDKDVWTIKTGHSGDVTMDLEKCPTNGELKCRSHGTVWLSGKKEKVCKLGVDKNHEREICVGCAAGPNPIIGQPAKLYRLNIDIETKKLRYR